MAVRLRLMRMGKKKQPTYRIVAADTRSPRDGRFLEIIGTYQPRLEPSGVKVDVERAVHWLKAGAQPSETVEKLLTVSGAMDVFRGTAAMPDAPVEITPPPKNVYVAASSRTEPADEGGAPPADPDVDEQPAPETAADEQAAPEAVAEQPEAVEAVAEQPEAVEAVAEQPEAVEAEVDEGETGSGDVAAAESGSEA